ncbi:hypothetical protein [Arenibaculum pallidiluteum]|uniref:hypothetical protein n=1 Tax=Arenibaculum pallidiluteum TaxID=2812559 RepID=UPI001A95A03B|nr:hypothetical protein [Arenibaculum pallidiluteum]
MAREDKTRPDMPDWRRLGPHHEASDEDRRREGPAGPTDAERPSWKPRGTEDRRSTEDR